MTIMAYCDIFLNEWTFYYYISTHTRVNVHPHPFYIISQLPALFSAKRKNGTQYSSHISQVKVRDKYHFYTVNWVNTVCWQIPLSFPTNFSWKKTDSLSRSFLFWRQKNISHFIKQHCRDHTHEKSNKNVVNGEMVVKRSWLSFSSALRDARAVHWASIDGWMSIGIFYWHSTSWEKWKDQKAILNWNAQDFFLYENELESENFLQEKELFKVLTLLYLFNPFC